MAKCPICGKTKPLKQDIIDHVENDHSSDIPENMSTAQYIYSLNHGRDYGLCRVCGGKTDWNEKTGKPKQLCNNPACKAKRRKIAQRNMINVYGKDNLLNDPLHQEKMLANRKISGTYTWSDGKHKFTYTGSYEKFAIEWLDKVMDYDPDSIEMPGPIVYYDLNGEKKPWITDMYLPELNLVIEFKDGSFDRNTHDGFKDNRIREAAKDDYMKKQSTYNYTKVTNKNMMSLVKVMEMIRLNNIFDDNKSKNINPIVVIHESADDIIECHTYLSNDEIDTICESISNNTELSFDEYEILTEGTTSEKVTGGIKEMYLKVVAAIKDMIYKWQGISEVNVSKKEKADLLKVLDLSKEVSDMLMDILVKEDNVSYETKYEELIDAVKAFKKSHKDKDKTEKIERKTLEDSVLYLEKLLKKSITCNSKHADKFKRALYITITRTLYCVNHVLYNASGRGHSPHMGDKHDGIVKYRYGKKGMSYRINNLNNKAYIKDKYINELIKATSYNSYKKIFDMVCKEYGKEDSSAIKLIDLKKHNKLVFVGYNKLKPMKLKAGTKLYHVSPNSAITTLNPAFKSKDNITFYSEPRVYFTDKIIKAKSVLPNLDSYNVYEYTCTKDTIAYRDSEYGSWYHHCLYIETNKPLTVKNITNELDTKILAKPQYESVYYNSIYNEFDAEIETLFEDINTVISDMSQDIDATNGEDIADKKELSKIENKVNNIYKQYSNLSDEKKIVNISGALNVCKKILNLLASITGVKFIHDGASGLKGVKPFMRDLKREMPMNHETYNTLKNNLIIINILKIVLGILLLILNLVVVHKLSLKVIPDSSERMANSIRKILGNTNNDAVKSLCDKHLKVLSKMSSITVATMENYDIVDLDDVLAEDVNSESAIMSVANISPIATNSKSNILEDIEGLESSPMMFGDGVYSSITDSNCQGFKTETIEDDSLLARLNKIKSLNSDSSESDQMFSEHEFGTWNPLDSSDNFREINENGKSPSREDLEVDPPLKSDIEADLPTTNNDLSSIANDIYSSNFGSGE